MDCSHVGNGGHLKIMACMFWTCMWHHLMTTTGRVFTSKDFALSPVRPFNEKSPKGVSGSKNNVGVLSEAGPAADDQMESDSDMFREGENSSGAKAKTT